MNNDGDKNYNNPQKRKAAVRPALPPSETSKIRPNAVRTLRLPEGQSLEICEFGAYPQDIVSQKISQNLEKSYQKRNLKTTGKSYTFDDAGLTDYSSAFKPKTYQEYEDSSSGKRYVRVEGKPADEDSILSDGIRVQKGEAYWLEVKPIEWLKDPSGVWVAKKALFSGVQFDSDRNYDGNFTQTDMKRYLDRYFSKEMQASRDYSASRSADVSEEKSFTPKQPSARQKKYGIQVVDEPMTVKDQIDFYVQNGMSFMLHGPSGVGKTARVEAIDPDLTAVPLWNGVLPEDVVGKVRYPDGKTGLPDENKSGGEWIAPDWYVELCKKSAAFARRSD